MKNSCPPFCSRWFSAGNIFAADIAEHGFFVGQQILRRRKIFRRGEGLRKHLHSPARIRRHLLFNYGNAEFKAGNLGKAIAAFRRAGLLAPRDPEIRANLAFVRNQVQGATVRESRWQNWLGNLTLNEWTLFAAIAFWLTFHFARGETTSSRARGEIKKRDLDFCRADDFFRHNFGRAGRESFFKANGCGHFRRRRRRAAGRLTTRKTRSRRTTARSFPFWIGATTGCKSRTAREKSAGCKQNRLKFCPAHEQIS